MKLKTGYIQPVYKFSIPDVNPPRIISYSQWGTYDKCPRDWKLSYIDGLKPFEPSIDTVFGTAFHETIQDWVTILYTKSVKESTYVDLHKELEKNMANVYKEEREKFGVNFTNQTLFAQYYKEGTEIIDHIVKNRTKYFPTKDWELVGIEVPLIQPASHHNENVYWLGYLDIVLYNNKSNKFKIIDIKTSKRGWNKYQKADKSKHAQLVAYKKYFADQFGVDLKSIDVEFMIVRRQIDEGAMYPPKRVQFVRPASGKPTINKVMKSIDAFVKKAFGPDGEKLAELDYPAFAGTNYRNCKYCPFDSEALCPKTERHKV